MSGWQQSDFSSCCDRHQAPLSPRVPHMLAGSQERQIKNLAIVEASQVNAPLRNHNYKNSQFVTAHSPPACTHADYQAMLGLWLI